MNYVISLAIVAAAFLSYKMLKGVLHRFADKKEVPDKRRIYIEKIFAGLTVITVILLLSLVWSLDLKGVSVIVSSVFAVVGVALFAQWSILSSVTASVIIFFTFPAKIGDYIRIVDGDNSLEGEIVEITLFQIEMRDKDGNSVLYPNNQLLQKPVIKLSKPTPSEEASTV